MTVTVLDTVTVFDGTDTVYRYDIPAAGISEGWAFSAAVDQIRQLAGPADAAGGETIRVELEADDDIDPELRRALSARGFLLDDDADNDGAATAEADAPPPAAPVRGRHRLTRTTRRRMPAVVLAGAAVLLALPLGVMAARSAGGAATPSPSTSTAAPTTSAAASTPPPAPTTSAAPTPTPDPVVTHRQDGLAMDTPRGYRITDQAETTVFTGPDPDLRIHTAADPVPEAGAESLLQGLRAQIDADPTLQEPVNGGGRLSYVERPGDGSEVRWQTWVVGDSQLSVGCHTRWAASPEQREICELAQASFRVEGPAEDFPEPGNPGAPEEV
ncbi:hypothetical protein B841_02785 [Corynebacterium maris DSM 45190]|uniref:Type VII secretion-associated protein n=1 Tax=Corynebacterium maris DSM 45190 TaxID=1224163 RepID=S5T0H7_9CORY|nr:hypothetical protein B841_02785 [Corynebacterium maris DSM 45190]